MTVLRDPRYELEPYPVALGGGWRLRLIKNDQEVGGGVFSLDPDIETARRDAMEEGEAWLSQITETG
jgi:hypothetical protein